MMLAIIWLAFSSGALAAPPVIGIYDDTASPSPSAWGQGLQAIERALTAAGLSTRRVTRDQLNAGKGLETIDVLVVGGGFAWPGYTRMITPAGKATLRKAVNDGMGFVGICAGAWFACRSIVYDKVRYGSEAGYDLGLLPAEGYGPVPTLPTYPSYGITQVRFKSHEATGEGGVRHVWYGGGPYFKTLPPGTEVLATYEVPKTEAEGLPAVIALRCGRGRVVLWGAHAELPGGTTEADNISRFARVVQWARRAP